MSKAILNFNEVKTSEFFNGKKEVGGLFFLNPLFFLFYNSRTYKYANSSRFNAFTVLWVSSLLSKPSVRGRKRSGFCTYHHILGAGQVQNV